MTDMAFGLLAPQITILVGILLVLLVEIVAPMAKGKGARNLPPILALLTMVVALCVIALRWDSATSVEGWSGMVTLDRVALFIQGVLVVAGGLAVLSAWDYLKSVGEEHSEFYALILAAVFGGMVLAAATDMVMIFLGIEILSISVYVLTGFMRRRVASAEGALKYFLLGAFSTGFLLYGMALLFGATGSTNLEVIARGVHAQQGIVLAGMALVLIGFGFKIAAFPFHVWTPDVYQGAPSPVSGFMAAAVKAAAFAGLLRVLAVAFDPLRDQWAFILYNLSIATMVFGNVAALIQKDIKRMLAYSSIAHAGYILVGIVAMYRRGMEPNGASAVVFYLLAYTLMTIGAFAVVSYLSRQEDDADSLDGYRGLAKRHPWLAGALAIYLVSMAGIPPMIGFVGKFVLFAAAIKSNLILLAVIGVLTSAVSVYYYIRVIYLMYMTDAESEEAAFSKGESFDLSGRITLVLTSLLVIILGILPQPLLRLAKESAMMLWGR